jgi:hypothetical protein
LPRQLLHHILKIIILEKIRFYSRCWFIAIAKPSFEWGDRLREIITTVDAPDFDEKIQAAILRQMQATDKSSEAEV